MGKKQICPYTHAYMYIRILFPHILNTYMYVCVCLCVSIFAINVKFSRYTCLDWTRCFINCGWRQLAWVFFGWGELFWVDISYSFWNGALNLAGSDLSMTSTLKPPVTRTFEGFLLMLFSLIRLRSTRHITFRCFPTVSHAGIVTLD